jgi:hypothetical protein
LIPIVCQLNNLKDPVSNMVEETLKKDYGFNDLRIDELRDGA